MPPTNKPLAWLHGEIKTPPFSQEARLEAGVLLRRLQGGESIGLPHSRPMPSVGAKVHELRIVDEATSWRIVYTIATDASVILEVFSKKTQQTPKAVINVCQQRLKQYLTAMAQD